jgi:hypothetical protein
LERTLADNPAFTRSILGAADPVEVRRYLDAFCQERLGSRVEEILSFNLSVGATFGLLLENGRRVFLKAHPPERPEEYLWAVHRVQAHLYSRGFPAPRPLAGPAPFGIGLATVDEFVDAGEPPDGHDPQVRKLAARTLALQIALAGEVEDLRGLEQGWPWPAAGELWPPPHNALFDFDATSKGAAWIDDTAARAREVVDGFDGRIVVGHTDWSVDHLRVADGEIRIVYDWDSLRPEKEVVVVGIAASNFTSTWRLGVPNPPSPEETWLFVEDYEGARGEPFSGAEREALAAAAIYAVAYIARCEHAIDPEGGELQGSFREALPRHADAYLPGR